MFQLRNILVAKDLSESAERALAMAYAMAGRIGARVHVVFTQVLHPDPFSPAAYPADHRRRVCDAMRMVVERVAAGSGIRPEARPEVEYAVVQGLAVAPAIVEYASRNEIDLVATGTHGRRGLRHMMLGSVAEEVVRTANCPVLTVHGRPGESVRLPGPGSDILVPIDFSDHSVQALRYARDLASRFSCALRLVHVVEESLHPAFYNAGAFSVYDLQPDVESRARAHLEQVFRSSAGPSVPVSYDVTAGHAAVEIARMTRDHPVGLVVMATHGLGGLAHLLLGSVAEKVVRTAASPVFSVKSFGRDLFDESMADHATRAR